MKFALFLIISYFQFTSGVKLFGLETAVNFEGVSEKCGQQLDEYITNLELNPNSWALQMLDATSKIPSGLLSLNFGEMGNFDQCINIQTDDIRGKYCLGSIAFDPNQNLTEYTRLQLALSSVRKFRDVSSATRTAGPTWAICVPDGCDSTDVNIFVNRFFKDYVDEGLNVIFSEMLCQTSESANPKLGTGGIITISILSVLLSVVILSTFYDVYFTQKPLLVRAFSLNINGAKIFKMSKSNSDQLPVLDGIRFFSMMWVVAGHQYSVLVGGSISNTGDVIDWSNKLYSMFLISGTLSVDTFLVVGGTLMYYGFLKAKQKGLKFNLFQYYIHRYIRLTVPLAVVVLVSATLLEFLGSGPRWPYMTLYFQKNCVDYWWSTLLYVQNYVNISKMCVGQTWYLSIDMQLYLVSPLIFYLLYKWTKVMLPLLVLSIVGFISGSFYVAWTNELPAILSNIYGNGDYSNKYYLLTHTRAAPWVIGIITGYLVFNMKNNRIQFRMKKYLTVIMWMICLGVLFACVLGGHSTLRGKDYDKWGNALHIAFVRPSWAFAISILILGCVSGQGGFINWFLSLSIYQVLNRFTYAIYLIHVSFLYAYGYSKKSPDYFSDFNMMYQFWGTLWFSAGLGILLVFAVESPVIVFEKELMSKLSKRKKTPSADIETGRTNLGFQK